MFMSMRFGATVVARARQPASCGRLATLDPLGPLEFVSDTTKGQRAMADNIV
jgi:hypothetical protein